MSIDLNLFVFDIALDCYNIRSNFHNRFASAEWLATSCTQYNSVCVRVIRGSGWLSWEKKCSSTDKPERLAQNELRTVERNNGFAPTFGLFAFKGSCPKWDFTLWNAPRTLEANKGIAPKFGLFAFFKCGCPKWDLKMNWPQLSLRNAPTRRWRMVSQFFKKTKQK